jgi:hypothetical protein
MITTGRSTSARFWITCLFIVENSPQQKKTENYVMQRPGKTYRAAPMDGPERIDQWSLVNFFKDAKEQTSGDVQFYMEQLETYFRTGYSSKKGMERASRVLGL